MAYTRIHGIKTTLNKAIDYIENPEKTEKQLLISGYNIDPLSASIEFKITEALAREIKGDYTKSGGANNLAYHMIQSFAPYDKITPEKAHELGKQWAYGILKDKYEYVISTHVDRGHIHNHIIFNSISFYDFKKFNNYKVAEELRKVSDRICKENGLHVIENPNLKKKSPTHYELEHRRAGTSWKAQIKDIIDKAIEVTTDYESFKKEVKKANVEIKEGKRISFRIIGTGQERFCRGDRIGEGYSKEKILERLAAPKHKKKVEQKEQVDNKTDFSYDKKVRWEVQRSKLASAKELAGALLTIRRENIQQESDFDIKIDNLLEKAASVRKIMKEIAEKNQQYKNVAKYLLAFKQYLPIQQEFEKQTSITKKKFANLHESELRAFDYAAKQLEKLGVNTNVDPEKVIALVKEQDRKISDLTTALKEVIEKIDSIRRAQQLVKNAKKITEQEPEQELWQDKKRDGRERLGE